MSLDEEAIISVKNVVQIKMCAKFSLAGPVQAQRSIAHRRSVFRSEPILLLYIAILYNK